MKLLKPTYRLSLIRYFPLTLAYCVLVLVAGFIISVTGGSGGWIGPLILFLMFLFYLYYTAVPAPSVLVLYPETQSAGHSGWRRIRKGAGHLAGVMVVIGAFLTVLPPIFVPAFMLVAQALGWVQPALGPVVWGVCSPANCGA